MLFYKSSSGINSISVWYSEILQTKAWCLESDCMALLVVRKQIKQVYPDYSWFLLRRRDYTFKFIIVALQHADVALELLNVLGLHRQKGRILISLTWAKLWLMLDWLNLRARMHSFGSHLMQGGILSKLVRPIMTLRIVFRRSSRLSGPSPSDLYF